MMQIEPWLDATFDSSYISLTTKQQIPCFYDVCYKTFDEVNQIFKDLLELKEGIPVEIKEYCAFFVIEEHVDEKIREHSHILEGHLMNKPVKKVW